MMPQNEVVDNLLGLKNVGDVSSNARGSAARYSEGKPELQQIPLQLWSWWFDGIDHMEQWMLDILEELATDWQPPSGVRDFPKGWGRTDKYFWTYVIRSIPPEVMKEAAQVLSYGAKKYAQWNWCKGQAWNIPVGCMLRHAMSIAEGEVMDPESNCSHRGHFACNVLFLAFFAEHYPEGADWILLPEIN